MTLTSAGASPAPWRSAPAELAPREVQEGEHTSSGEDPSGPDVTPQPAFAHGRATLWLIRAHQFLRERLLVRDWYCFAREPAEEEVLAGSSGHLFYPDPKRGGILFCDAFSSIGLTIRSNNLRFSSVFVCLFLGSVHREKNGAIGFCVMWC